MCGITDQRDDRVGGQIAVNVARQQAVLEPPARIENPVQPLPHEELVLLLQLGVVPGIAAGPGRVQPSAKVVIGCDAGLGIGVHSGTSMRKRAVLNDLPVTS